MFRALFFLYVIASSAFTVFYGAFLLSLLLGGKNSFFGILFFVLSIAVASFNIVGGAYYYFGTKNKAQKIAPLPKNLPKIAVAVPTCDEDPEMVFETVLSVKKLDYPRGLLEFWLLDNSTVDETKKRLKDFCAKNGVRYVHREKKLGYKAGSLNNMISLSDAEFLAVFDADERLLDKSFLKENLGFFYENEKLAFVQTVKKAKKSGLFANSADATYSFFYDYVQPVRSDSKMAMYCGSLGLVKISSLKAVGGFPCQPPTPTEDTAYSFKANLAGFDGIYVKKIYALGMPIENYSTFVRQQWKYVYGNARLFWEYLDNFSRIPAINHVHYFTQLAGFPFMSIVFLLFAVISAGFVLSDLSDTILAFSKPVQDITRNIQFFEVIPIIANIVSILFVSRVYFGSVRIGAMTMLLNFALAIQRSEAALTASAGKSTEIWVTAKKKVVSNSFFNALRQTARETAYSTFFVVLALVALSRGDVVGAYWLFWYAVLFYSALVFAYLYK